MRPVVFHQSLDVTLEERNGQVRRNQGCNPNSQWSPRPGLPVRVLSSLDKLEKNAVLLHLCGVLVAVHRRT